jgi:very-short-patch-repair endonuclease
MKLETPPDRDELLSKKYRQLLGYLAELDRLRIKRVRTLADHHSHYYLGELPTDEAITYRPGYEDEWLVVTRPKVIPPPEPPLTLRNWLSFNWKLPDSTPSHLDKSFGEGLDEAVLWSDAGLERDWESYVARWREWSVRIIPKLAVNRLYDQLYDIRARIEREPESLELVVGDVFIRSGRTDHPILFSVVEIKFDPEKAEISLSCVSDVAEVFSECLRDADIDFAESLGKARGEVSANDEIWPLGDEPTDLFAKRLIQGASPDGAFFARGEDFSRGDSETIAYRRPCLVFRDRSTGLAELVQTLLDKFREDGEVPFPICPILVPKTENETEGDDTKEVAHPDEDLSVYFTKPANQEQLNIVRAYRRNKVVQVQGPPGTGKTHTIANLIGHFLAEGKSVLVTSEKELALKTVRDKLPRSLRPLCISLLRETEGHGGLKEGVRELHERLGPLDARQLDKNIEQLEDARLEAVRELHAARRLMNELLAGERTRLEHMGSSYSPSQAAEFVRLNQLEDGWLVGQVKSNTVPPLSDPEFLELVSLTNGIEPNDEWEIERGIPERSELPDPSEVSENLEQLRTARARLKQLPSTVIARHPGKPISRIDLEAAQREVNKALISFGMLKERWVQKLASEAAEVPAVALAWEKLLGEADRLRTQEVGARSLEAAYGFKVDPTVDTDLLIQGLQLLAEATRNKGSKILKPRLLKSSDKVVFSNISTASTTPLGSLDSFIDAQKFIRHSQEVKKFNLEWRARMRALGEDPQEPTDLIANLARLRPTLEQALNWVSGDCERALESVTKAGYAVAQALLLVPQEQVQLGIAPQRAWLLQQIITPEIDNAIFRDKAKDFEDAAASYRDVLVESCSDFDAECVRGLKLALASEDEVIYAEHHANWIRLLAVRETLARRNELASRLHPFAADLTESVKSRLITPKSIGASFASAWKWSLYNQEISKLLSLTSESVKEQVDRAKNRVDEVTVLLAEKKAWRRQLDRVTPVVANALARYESSIKAMKGMYGKRVPQYLVQARAAMKDAKDAFPVWVMPMAEVAKSFDFGATSFDVVIVDEATQLGATGLLALLIGKSAIVVGDDEQSEPSLGGLKIEEINSLVAEHLVDFPERVLWGPDSSLYGFAKFFGKPIRLSEHFRCVPEIIAFSSKLCYKNSIQPLRESADVVRRPFVVGYRVHDAFRDRYSNRAEAEHLVSLMLATAEQPEYSRASLGAIATMGDQNDQVRLIEEILRSKLDRDYDLWHQAHNFKCGIPSAFQGEERKVVFISTVDTSSTGSPLRLNQDDKLKKKLNVAVSRAEDQVWILHSVDPETDLKEKDLRKELLHFAYASKEWLKLSTADNPKADSPFEQSVYRQLHGMGYQLVPQYKVGGYYLDFAVVGANRRVALECDGDAYHQDVAADLARQITLERCGWQFVRVRGSEYYRDPDAAISRICAKLEALGVMPVGMDTTPKQPEGELLDRILARAQELRTAWAQGESPVSRWRDESSEPMLGVSEEDASHPGDALSSTFARVGSADQSTSFDGQSLFGVTLERTPTTELELYIDPREEIVDAHEVIGVTHGALQAYVEFNEKGLPDPRLGNTRDLRLALIRIVQIEGPVTVRRVLDQYRVGAGYQRLKGPTRDAVIRGINRCLEKELLHTVEEYGPSFEDTVLQMPGAPPIRVRQRGPRDLEDIPINEIAALAQELRLGHVGLEGMRTLLSEYQLKRLTEGAYSRLRKALEM